MSRHLCPIAQESLILQTFGFRGRHADAGFPCIGETLNPLHNDFSVHFTKESEMRIRNLSLILVLMGVATLFSHASVRADPAPCPDNFQSPLRINNYGRVLAPAANQTLGPVRIHSDPATDSPVIALLDPGSVFAVLPFPSCSQNTVWWRIVSETGTQGWIAQGDSTGLFVEGLNEPSSDPNATPVPIVKSPGGAFAAFNADKADMTGAVTPYTVAPDLNNVIVTNLLNHDQRVLLGRSGFVVSPATYLEFDAAYRDFETTSPILITPDSLLHSFHLMFDKVLRTSEEQRFLPLLSALNGSLLKQAESIYQASKGTAWEESAKTTLAYVGVATQLADPTTKVPDVVAALVAQEVKSITDASGIGASAVFPRLKNGEDWSQYIPRGHYTRDDALKQYFRTMMYYGRMTFRLSDPGETQSALLLVAALSNTTVEGASGLDIWENLYEPTVFFVGQSDDLSIPQYSAVMQQVYGTTSNVQTLQSKGVDAFVTAAKALPAPRIVGMLVNDNQDVTDSTQGLRFMGQRFVWDAYAFSQLMYKYVGSRDNPRGLPMALDIFAVMGSARALQILDSAGATHYANYSTQMANLQKQFGALSETDRTATLYNTWLYLQNTLVQPVPSGYPSYMLTPAYADRLLNGALGSFAELKHDTILYTKQPEGMGGGGLPCDLNPPLLMQPVYVDPVPLFWARLAALAETSLSGLGKRNLLTPTDTGALTQIANLARRFERDSIVELKNQPLSAQEQATLNPYGNALQMILMATSDSGLQGLFDMTIGAGNFKPPHAALIADIATDAASGNVLEIGTGNIFNIFATVPIGGKLVVARGAVYSYYEFPHPMTDRLTDESWQTLLGQPSNDTPDGDPNSNTAQAPALPGWTASFSAPNGSESTFQKAIQNLQGQLSGALYFFEDGTPSDDALGHFINDQMAPLRKSGENEARQLVSTRYDPIQLSSDGNTATVVAAETWQAQLRPRTEQGCAGTTVLGHRGPYTIHMQYVFTRSADSDWALTSVRMLDAPPAWSDLLPIPPTPTPGG
jgi:hypothetical protein